MKKSQYFEWLEKEGAGKSSAGITGFVPMIPTYTLEMKGLKSVKKHAIYRRMTESQ
jgi:hypothetical protein